MQAIYLLEASVAADLITRKVGLSVNAQEGYILCAMHVALKHRHLFATVHR